MTITEKSLTTSPYFSSKPVFTKDGMQRSQEKLQALQVELQHVRDEKEIAYLGSGDGWHDNPGYTALEQQEQRLIDQIAAQTRLLQNGVVLDVTDGKRASTQIAVGSIVELTLYSLKEDTKTVIYEIVGHQESDPQKGRIGYDTPLGRELLNLKKGETRMIKIPKGMIEAEVVRFYQSWQETCQQKSEVCV